MSRLVSALSSYVTRPYGREAWMWSGFKSKVQYHAFWWSFFLSWSFMFFFFLQKALTQFLAILDKDSGKPLKHPISFDFFKNFSWHENRCRCACWHAGQTCGGWEPALGSSGGPKQPHRGQIFRLSSSHGDFSLSFLSPQGGTLLGPLAMSTPCWLSYS